MVPLVRTASFQLGAALTGRSVFVSMARVLNIKTDDVSDAVYIGRGSPYGNPYKRGVDGTKAQVIDLFVKNVLPQLDVSELRGKDLACFCAPKSCHGDHILKKANESTLDSWL